MSTPANPFREMERLFRRMSEQIQEASEQYGMGTTAEDIAIDLVDADEEYVLKADLPGFEKEDIDLRVVGQRLRMTADRETELEEEGESYVHRERHHRTLRRTIDLPGDVDPTDVEAQFANGVLTIRIPKTEPRDEGEAIAIDG